MHPILPLKKKKRRSFSLKAQLVGAVLASIGTTAAIVHIPWLMTSRQNVDSVISQVNGEISHGTSQEVDNIFNNVRSSQNMIRDAYNLGLVDLNNPEARKKFYLSMLEAHPNFTWIQFGFSNGDFFGSQRVQGSILNFIERDWNPNLKKTTKTTESFQIDSADIETYLHQTKRDVIQENPAYISTQRPWYLKAMENPGQVAWTDVYVFRSTNTPGIDSAVTLTQGGKVVGVISIAFELQKISNYLKNLQGDRSGIIFIVNTKTELIASTDSKELAPIQEANQDRPRLKKLQEANNPYLRLVNEELERQHLSIATVRSETEHHREFTATDPKTGKRYYISLMRLKQLDWVVGTVIPESNYTKAIDQNKRTLFFVVSGFISVAALAAVLLTDRLLARPMMQMTKAAATVESGSFEVSALDNVAQRPDELGRLARVFQTMAKEVQAREQQLKQQVQELRIEIDQTKRKKQVNEIVESDFFQDLQTKARSIRRRDRKAGDYSDTEPS